MGYYFPAEWQPQSGIMLTWPHSNSYWNPILAKTQSLYATLIKEITAQEKVLLICENKAPVQRFLQEVGVALSNVIFVEVPSNDVWVRDYGPITIFQDGNPLLLDFTFNAWGEKYDMSLDNLITRRINESGVFCAPLNTIDFILEGGSIDTDGKGTLLTTRRCLLEKGRNKNQTQVSISNKLKTTLGIERVLWLSQGHIPGDDTDAHVDTLARFVDPETIVYQDCNDPRMLDELKTFKNYKDKPYRLLPLPNIQAKFSQLTGERLPASYANFLITDKKVLVPTYNDIADEHALEIIAGCFSNRTVIGINSLLLIENFGSIHCISMQLPEGVLK